MRIIGPFIVLMALWLLLSGLYKPLIVGFGVVSALLAVYFVRRMDDADDYVVPLVLRPFSSFAYFLWLLVEIAKANWAVTKIIMAPVAETRQHLFSVKHSQKTDVGQVIFANSITLTPGTITVETEDERFLVHALNFSPDDMDALRDMDRRVTVTEHATAATKGRG
ncbi:Na+/H+ antiporter subunit E [Rhodobacteraceae bacterium D3-12]|nr:Na+/H+ antiporter subunit E [Rhodobacteraceae bacterium D3-12]